MSISRENTYTYNIIFISLSLTTRTLTFTLTVAFHTQNPSKSIENSSPLYIYNRLDFSSGAMMNSSAVLTFQQPRRRLYRLIMYQPFRCQPVDFPTQADDVTAFLPTTPISRFSAHFPICFSRFGRWCLIGRTVVVFAMFA